MSLEANVDALAARIAAEIVAVRSEAGDGIPLFVQQTEPVVTGPALWYQTDVSGNVIDIKIQVS